MKLKQYLVENYKFKTDNDQTGHSHDISVDDNGDGKTTKTIGVENHIHKVFQWTVQPAGGHLHNMDA